MRNVKRDIFIWQKRPIDMAKEACSHGKRGLLTLAYRRRKTMMEQRAQFDTQLRELEEKLWSQVQVCARVERDLFIDILMAKEAY